MIQRRAIWHHLQSAARYPRIALHSAPYSLTPTFQPVQADAQGQVDFDVSVEGSGIQDVLIRSVSAREPLRGGAEGQRDAHEVLRKAGETTSATRTELKRDIVQLA